MAHLPQPYREKYRQRLVPGDNKITELANDRLVVDMLVDIYRHVDTPALRNVLGQTGQTLFLATEVLPPCKDVFEVSRVNYRVGLNTNFGKPLNLAYHTEHIVTTTGRERLAKGALQAILGVCHDYPDRFEIEPLIIGTPLLNHPRNGSERARDYLMFSPYSPSYGEILPEDIDEFREMKNVTVNNVDTWAEVMRHVREEELKKAFATRLSEPTKKTGAANPTIISRVTCTSTIAG